MIIIIIINYPNYKGKPLSGQLREPHYTNSTIIWSCCQNLKPARPNWWEASALNTYCTTLAPQRLDLIKRCVGAVA